MGAAWSRLLALCGGRDPSPTGAVQVSRGAADILSPGGATVPVPPPALRFASARCGRRARFYESLCCTAWGPDAYLAVQVTFLKMEGVPTMWHGVLRGQARGGSPVLLYLGERPSAVAVSGGTMAGDRLHAYVDGPAAAPTVTIGCAFEAGPVELAAARCRRHAGCERSVDGGRWSQQSWDVEAPGLTGTDLPVEWAQVTLTRCDAAPQAVMHTAVIVRWSGDDVTVDLQLHFDARGEVVWFGGTVAADGEARPVRHATYGGGGGAGRIAGTCDLETAAGTVSVALDLARDLEPLAPTDAAPWVVRQVIRRLGHRAVVSTQVGLTEAVVYGRAPAMGACIHEHHGPGD